MRYLTSWLVLAMLACGGGPSSPDADLSGQWSYSAAVSSDQTSCEAAGYLLTIEDGQATLEGGTVTCNEDVCGDAFAGSGRVRVDGSDLSFSTSLIDHQGTLSGLTLSGEATIDRFEHQCAEFSVTILDDGVGRWEARR